MADRAVVDYHTNAPAHPMTYIPETLRQAREALLQSAAALHVIAQSLEGADEPAPTSPPPSVLTPEQVASMERTKANGGWITDKLPTEMDANFENDVKVPNVLDKACPYEWAKYYTVQLGAPWCSPDDTPAPWDPTTLDRNGWIRSRLPTVEDANSTGLVLLPMGKGGVNSTIAYDLIVPGQPWAPWSSNPGVFEK